jgi:hypothetical protein
MNITMESIAGDARAPLPFGDAKQREACKASLRATIANLVARGASATALVTAMAELSVSVLDAAPPEQRSDFLCGDSRPPLAVVEGTPDHAGLPVDARPGITHGVSVPKKKT